MAVDVEEVLATIEVLVARRLHRRGLTGGGDDAMTAWADEAPVCAELAAAMPAAVVSVSTRR